MCDVVSNLCRPGCPPCGGDLVVRALPDALEDARPVCVERCEGPGGCGGCCGTPHGESGEGADGGESPRVPVLGGAMVRHVREAEGVVGYKKWQGLFRARGRPCREFFLGVQQALPIFFAPYRIE